MKNKRVKSTHLHLNVPLWVKDRAHSESIKRGISLSQYIKELLEQELAKGGSHA